MFLIAFNTSSGEVEIHKAGCADIKRMNKTRKGHRRSDQVEFGNTDWPTKYAFAYEYWDNGILDEYEAEHGEGSFDVWDEMDFQPCTRELPDGGPETEAAPAPRAKGQRDKNQMLARWLANTVARNIGELDPSDHQKVVNWIKHLPTGDGSGPDRYWPEGLLRPNSPDWQK